MMSVSSSNEREALAWLTKLNDPGFADWDGLTNWLEADAGNAVLFGRLRERDEVIAQALKADASHPLLATPPEPANDRDRRPWRWALGAVAAAVIVGALGIGLHSPHLSSRSDAQEIATAGGAPRDLTLAGGTRVALNGNSRLKIIDGRHVELLAGEARFEIAHDAAHPFAVIVGDATITDVGTRFDVVHDAGRFAVGVADGMISLDVAGADRVMLGAGRSFEQVGSDIRLGTVVPADVGSWREGRLSYENAPLDRIAGDIQRVSGRVIRLAPGLTARRFTGTVLLDSDDDRFRVRLGGLLGVEIKTTNGAWTLTPSPHATS